jgi:dihydroorotase
MSILIKSATILEPGSALNNKKHNIFISDAGIIKHVGMDAPTATKTIDGANLKVSIGWFDLRANFNDPGLEHKEDLESGLNAAASGGFTGVALLPNTKPVVESKNEVSYLMSKNQKSVCQIYPMGAVTKGCKGEDFTEILDMHAAGAVAFTDGENPIWNTDIMLKSLLYLQKINGLLINRPEDKYLTAFGTMNEGVTSTLLGMKGIPGLAEEIMVRRDIELLKYAGGKVHFANISTAAALKQIVKAKKNGLNVTCDVTAYNLIFNDSVLMDYDTNYKVNPPLRSKKDINALLKGIEEGGIDVVVSSHTPQDEESKKLEFDLADFGMLGLQTFLPMIIMARGGKIDRIIDRFTTNPRKILGIDIPEIKEGEKADLTIFDTDLEWKYDASANWSKSVNSPWFGKILKGAVIGVINNGKSFFNDFS